MGTARVWRRSPAGLFACALVALAAPALTTALPRAAVAQTAVTRQFSFAIKQRRIDAADNVIRVNQGDVVDIVLSGDEPAELHLHGYDIKLDLTPDAPGRMHFDARIAGRFPLEAHRFGAGTGPGRSRVTGALLYVEVLPR